MEDNISQSIGRSMNIMIISPMVLVVICTGSETAPTHELRCTETGVDPLRSSTEK